MIIRLWILAPLLFVVINLSGQTRYFIIPDQPEGYTIDRYKLSTDKLYGAKETVALFTLTFSDSRKAVDTDKPDPNTDLNLILLSVLPDLDGNSDWTEINIDTVKNNIITSGHLRNLFNLSTFSEFDKTYGAKTKYFDEYQIIKKIDSKYFVSKHCLLQFYAVRNRPSIFQNSFGTINIEQEPIKIPEMETIFKKRYPGFIFPPYSIGETPYSYRNASFNFLRDRKEYLSKVIKLKNNDLAYQFWTYTNWHQHDDEYEIDRGIDRFVYLPGKGIIGGSFDFYFYFHRKKLPIKYADFMNNIKEEKVMIADIFK